MGKKKEGPSYSLISGGLNRETSSQRKNRERKRGVKGEKPPEESNHTERTLR